NKVSAPYLLHIATHGFFLPDTTPPGAEPDLLSRGIGGIKTLAPESTGSDDGSHQPVVIESAAPIRMAFKHPMHRSGLALAGAQSTLEAWKRGDVPPPS